MDSTDSQLIANANKGQQQAFEEIYKRYKAWVYTTAYRYCGNEPDASDVTQETFMYLFKKFPGFTLTCKMKTFLYPVVKHTFLRQKAKRKEVLIEEHIDQELLESTHKEQPVCNNAVANMTIRLPKMQRETVLLRFSDGLSLQEISEAQDIPLGTVKSRLHKALKALKDVVRANS